VNTGKVNSGRFFSFSHRQGFSFKSRFSDPGTRFDVADFIIVEYYGNYVHLLTPLEAATASMPLAILKFGSSVLKCAAHLHVAVEEIHRSLLQGTRVVAVVSALGSTTDRLLEEAGPFQRAPDLACHLARGEEATVNLLIQALGRAGIPASRLDADRGGIGTRGPLLEANPVALNREAYGTALAAAPVVVVPGFVGHTLDGRPSLLGRGGPT